MRKIYLVVLPLVFVLSGCSLNSPRQLTDLEKQNKSLQEQLNGIQQSNVLDLQTKCYNQAYKFVKDGKYDILATYQGFTDHYNSKLSRCFVLIKDSDIAITNHGANLYDASEGKFLRIFILVKILIIVLYIQMEMKVLEKYVTPKRNLIVT